MGTAEDKPAQRHLYKVSTGSVGAVQCITCGTLNSDGKECTYNSVDFSTGSTYYVHGCNGPNAPRSVIKRTLVIQIFLTFLTSRQFYLLFQKFILGW